MTPNDYQTKALRTKNAELTMNDTLLDGALGLAGEAGEVADLIKKAFYQEHSLQIEKLMEELGDCLWYIALLADVYGWHLEEIMRINIAKLEKRYPEGKFTGEASRARIDVKHE